MSEFTKDGVVTKTLDEWYNAVVDFKRAVWGEDFVTDPSTKQGADILQLAELLYNAEMNNVSAFAQLNLNTAAGICLDYIGLVRGIQRNGGFPQEIKVDLTLSTTGWTLTPAVTFRTLDGYNYYPSTDYEITDFNQQVTLVYSSDGNPPVSDGTPLQTVQPNTNIVSAVIAQGGVTEGSPTESDEQYRKRIKDADIGFVGTLELMASEMSKIQGLSKCRILYNDDDTTDSDGVAPYKTEFLVVPDEGTDVNTFTGTVADKILEIKVPGAPLQGTETEQVADYYGETKNVKFTIATKVMVQFYAKIAANPMTGTLDTSNVEIEKKAISDYVQSVDVGDPISWSRILGIVAQDHGFMVVGWGLRYQVVGGWSDWKVNEDIGVNDIREYLWTDEDNIDISTDAPGNLS